MKITVEMTSVSDGYDFGDEKEPVKFHVDDGFVTIEHGGSEIILSAEDIKAFAKLL